jgi:hypothetical protein
LGRRKFDELKVEGVLQPFHRGIMDCFSKFILWNRKQPKTAKMQIERKRNAEKT